MIIVEENEKDDKVDDDKDGKADVSELSGRELVKRKVILILTKMNPEKVNDALASIYMGASTPVSKHLVFLPVYIYPLSDLFYDTHYDLTATTCL